MNKKTAALVSITLAALVALVRCYNDALLVFSVSDAQGGIALMFSLVVGLFTFGLGYAFAYNAVLGFVDKRSLAACLWGLGFLGIATWAGADIARCYKVRAALADTSDSSTSPERLRELIGFNSSYGYEIDNRIASNPSSSEDILRALYAKGRVGTLTKLAQNPNTPDDILVEVSVHPDEQVRKAWSLNPKVKKSRTSRYRQ
jgi:hypothetical protein